MHRQALEHFEEEEAGEGQGDKQQRIFDRPVALEVLVHRVDEAHAEGPAAERVTTIARFAGL